MTLRSLWRERENERKRERGVGISNIVKVLAVQFEHSCLVTEKILAM